MQGAPYLTSQITGNWQYVARAEGEIDGHLFGLAGLPGRKRGNADGIAETNSNTQLGGENTGNYP
jgi:hypothetical protein